VAAEAATGSIGKPWEWFDASLRIRCSPVFLRSFRGAKDVVDVPGRGLWHVRQLLPGPWRRSDDGARPRVLAGQQLGDGQPRRAVPGAGAWAG